jgi:MFS transporter, DHA2 family, multidrug resistance protein
MKPSKLLVYNASAILFMIIFVFTSTNMASLYILGSLGGSATTASYALAFFGVGNTLSVPLGQALGDKIGQKKLLAISMISFTIFVFLAAFSTTYFYLLFFRLLQGISSGPSLILITGLLNKLANEEMQDNYIRLIILVFISAAIIGASFGGTIAYASHWRSIFYLSPIPIIILTSTLFYQLRNLKSPPHQKVFDGFGYFLYVIAISSLSLFCILGQQLDWFRSAFLIACFLMTLIFIPAFLIRTFTTESPLFNLRLLKQPGALFSLLNIAIIFGAFFAMVQLLSVWLKLYINYSTNWVAISLATSLISAVGVMYCVRKIPYRISLRVLFVAVAFLAFSCFYTATFDAHVDFARIAISRVIAGVGLALFLPPLFHILFSCCKCDEGLSAITLFQTTRTLASGLSPPLFYTLWQHRDAFYHLRLGGELTPFSENTTTYLDTLTDYSLSKGEKISTLAEALDRQSLSLALNDTFYLMGWMMVGMLILIPLFHLYREKQALKKIYPF